MAPLPCEGGPKTPSRWPYFSVTMALSRRNMYRRMSEFFTAARVAGLAVAGVSVLMSYIFADRLIAAFIADVETVRLGAAFLRARCFATPFMFLSFK